jgi:L-asparagine oxygenase
MTEELLVRPHAGGELFDSLRALLGDEPIWPSDVLVVAASDASSPAMLSADGDVAAQLAAGGRAVVVDATADALLRLRWAGVRVQPMAPIAGPNPLVRAETVHAAGAGLWAGLTVSLTDLVALNGEPFACFEGEAVVARWQVGTGELIVLPGLWTDRLDAADNRVAVLRALTAEVGSPAERDLAQRRDRPGIRGSHPAVEEVRARDWDLSLLPTAGQKVNAPAFTRAAGHAGRLLPADIHDALVDFADTGNDAGALLLRGVPVGDVPPTPPSPRDARKRDRVSEFALLTVARRLGQPVGYAPEHGGDLVQNISPVEGDAERQVSTSSRSNLAFHTEAAFHPHRPRFLLLLCLRGDPAAATTLCSVHAVLDALSPADRSVLAMPRFTTAADESYVGGPSTRRSLPRPILVGDSARPKLWLDADLMRGVDDEAQGALDRLSALVAEQASGVVLEAGDLLVVDNDVAVHGRSPFSPRFDGRDRWLQRTFVVADHTAADGERAGRIVGTRFLA